MLLLINEAGTLVKYVCTAAFPREFDKALAEYCSGKKREYNGWKIEKEADFKVTGEIPMHGKYLEEILKTPSWLLG